MPILHVSYQVSRVKYQQNITIIHRRTKHDLPTPANDQRKIMRTFAKPFSSRNMRTVLERLSFSVCGSALDFSFPSKVGSLSNRWPLQCPRVRIRLQSAICARSSDRSISVYDNFTILKVQIVEKSSIGKSCGSIQETEGISFAIRLVWNWRKICKLCSKVFYCEKHILRSP